MLIEFFVMILGGAVASLIVGIMKKKWLLTMFATVLFLMLALQAFKIEVVSGGVTLIFQDIIITYLGWFGGFVSFIFTLVGMANTVRQKRADASQGEYQR